MTDAQRLYRATELMPRVEQTGDGLTIEGYLTVFDEVIKLWDPWTGDYYERIDPKAFNRTLKARTPIMLFNHGYDVTGRVPVGVWNTLKVDERGLWGSGRLFNNDLVKPVRDAIEGRALTGQSITFYPEEDRRTEDYKDGLPLITRKTVKLVEGGPVTMPAYETTTVGVRSLGISGPLTEAQKREIERIVKGLPASERDAMEMGVHPLTARQVSIVQSFGEVVDTFGKFDQSDGPDGAHYMAPSPFPALRCANCAFYDGQRMCEIVDGDVAPDAVCKLWVIPGDLVAERAARVKFSATRGHAAPGPAPLPGNPQETSEPLEATTSRDNTAAEGAAVDPYVAALWRRHVLKEH